MARIELKVALKKHATPKPDPENFKFFCEQLKKLEKEVSTSSSIDESEENVKKDINDFLSECFYKGTNYINTRNNIDSAIYKTQDKNSPIQVLIEAKRPEKNGNQFPTEQDLNKKALQETVLYYLQERDNDNDRPNDDLKHIVITNGLEWFLFDASEFETYFNKNRELLNRYSEHKAKSLPDNSREYFYKTFAAAAIEEAKDKLNYIYFDIRKLKGKGDLGAAYNILSPYYLLKKTYVSDSNTLNQKFYDELLHIIGLQEKQKKIVRPNEGREEGSLLENTISKLMQNQYGDYGNDLFEKALQQVIVWINRILFLKLLEAQLVKWHGNDKTYKFMTTDNLQDYGDLNDLFFGVLAFPPDKRPNSKLREKYHNVPYLNSSLFEPQQGELFISSLTNGLDISVLNNSVLKGERGKPMNALRYLLLFLDSFDFGSSERDTENIADTDTLINASVLGRIFEKINGYKDGSYFTPGFITQYMCHETIQNAVVQKFNKEKNWDCQTFAELTERVRGELIDKNLDKEDANQIINSLRICDPAVGSGHFLVSALNEIIAIKSELRVLRQTNGSRLAYHVEVENDELIVRDEEGKMFLYKPDSKNQENQTVQESLFEEKRTIIENCLFGVDINPNSVNICRLRLWIELLKNAYYKDGELKTLPNIDINIKCGNSLLSYHPVKMGESVSNVDNLETEIKEYKKYVKLYYDSNKEDKPKVQNAIDNIKKKIAPGIQLRLELEADDIAANKKAIDDNIYRNSMEWMIEFPKVLDREGRFIGFDIVIGNPPWGAELSIEAKSKFKTIYPEIDSSTPNSYAYFIGWGLRYYTSSLMFVLPDSILIKDFKKTRELLSSKVREVIWYQNCGVPKGKKLFRDVEHDVCIVYLDNMNHSSVHFQTNNYENGRYIPEDNVIAKKDVFRKEFDYVFNLKASTKDWALASKLLSHQPLDEIAQCHEGIHSGNIRNKLFVKENKPGLKPLYYGSKNGDKIEPYVSYMCGWFVDYRKNIIDKNTKDYASLRDERLFIYPKIYITRTGNPFKAFYDEDSYASNNFFSMQTIDYKDNTKDNLLLLLPFINSNVCQFFIRKFAAPRLGDSYVETKITHLLKFTIPSISSEQRQKIIALVDQILVAKKQDPQVGSELENKIKGWEKEIDLLVYHLYGLTYDEAKMIDETITEEDFAATK
ncbi:MAG: hypothetical protein J6U04_05285 [Salinivirgaceae bacterium]|nr:hypothetical protein [Salinivirgaceae bacterium]